MSKQSPRICSFVRIPGIRVCTSNGCIQPSPSCRCVSAATIAPLVSNVSGRNPLVLDRPARPKKRSALRRCYSKRNQRGGFPKRRRAPLLYCRVVDTLAERVTVDPEQCGGRPCIRGMRIRVSDVLDLFAAGLTAEQILEEMPDLEPEDLQASLRFASRWLDHPVLVA